MDLDKFLVIDIEGDSLEPTKIHVMSWSWMKGKKMMTSSTKDYATMRQVLSNPDFYIVGHNFSLWDVPMAIEPLLGITPISTVIDSMLLSQYLYPERKNHKLADWGEELGIPKPEIDDWENLTYEEYKHRCEEDTKINLLLWKKQLQYLRKLYTSDEKLIPFLKYIAFKSSCITEQIVYRWKFDVEFCMKALNWFQEQKEEKYEELLSAMPQTPSYAVANPPKNKFKKDGELSVAGARWFDRLDEQGLNYNHHEPVRYIKEHVPPNPNSNDQVKNWLYSLGWKPNHFVFRINSEGEEKQIPQIRKDGELTKSVKRLIEKDRHVEALDGYTVLNHRIGILKGFLKNASSDGFLTASVFGLTNSLRWRHAILVNLPGVSKNKKMSIEDGFFIRRNLIAPEGYELLGSDMSSLEDRCKFTLIYKLDPEYSKTALAKGFDPHLSLAVYGKAVNKEDEQWYKDWEDLGKPSPKKFNKLKKIRDDYKTTNYSALYGVGKDKLSRELDITTSKARKLLADYWKKNWAVKKVTENTYVKTLNRQQWLYNPKSKFWYSLRHKKDTFSVLNQGFGAFVFDTWVYCVKELVSKYMPENDLSGVIIGQFHDEIIGISKLGERDKWERVLKESIDLLNKRLNYPIKFGCDWSFGPSYAHIH